MGTYNRLKAVLAENKRTNRWLAEQLEITELTVSRWATNARQPTLETLFKIAELLKVTVCDLIAKPKEE
jgi:DNA-binding Xre family transcriptional regulator